MKEEKSQAGLDLSCHILLLNTCLDFMNWLHSHEHELSLSPSEMRAAISAKGSKMQNILELACTRHNVSHAQLFKQKMPFSSPLVLPGCETVMTFDDAGGHAKLEDLGMPVVVLLQRARLLHLKKLWLLLLMNLM